MTGSNFIEYHMLRKMIFSIHIVNMPTKIVFFITNEDGLKTLRTTVCMKFWRYSHKALAPPYMQMGEIRFGFIHDLIWSGICW